MGGVRVVIGGRGEEVVRVREEEVEEDKDEEREKKERREEAVAEEAEVGGTGWSCTMAVAVVWVVRVEVEWRMREEEEVEGGGGEVADEGEEMAEEKGEEEGERVQVGEEMQGREVVRPRWAGSMSEGDRREGRGADGGDDRGKRGRVVGIDTTIMWEVIMGGTGEVRVVDVGVALRGLELLAGRQCSVAVRMMMVGWCEGAGVMVVLEQSSAAMTARVCSAVQCSAVQCYLSVAVQVR